MRNNHLCGNLRKTVPSVLWAQPRLKSACASAQSDQNLRGPHEETLQLWLSKMCTVKILIRLRECAGWSESSLGTRGRKYVFNLMALFSCLGNCISIAFCNWVLEIPLTVILPLPCGCCFCLSEEWFSNLRHDNKVVAVASNRWVILIFGYVMCDSLILC